MKENPSAVTVVTVEEPKEAILVVTDQDVQSLLALANYEVTDIHSKDQIKEVHERRMKLVRARRRIDEVRKSRNEEYKKIIDENNANAKKLTAILAPAEQKLEQEEDRVEKALAAEREAKAKAVYDARRVKMLTINWDLPEATVKAMSDEVFDQTFIQMSAVYRERIRLQEEAAKAAAVLAEQERRDREERERQEAAEAEARRVQAEQEEARRRQVEEELRRQREELARQQEEFAAERRRLAEEIEAARIAKKAFEEEVAAQTERLAKQRAKEEEQQALPAAEVLATAVAAVEPPSVEPEQPQALAPVPTPEPSIPKPAVLFPEFADIETAATEPPQQAAAEKSVECRFLLEADHIQMLRQAAIEDGYMNDMLAVILDSAVPGEYVKRDSRWQLATGA